MVDQEQPTFLLGADIIWADSPVVELPSEDVELSIEAVAKKFNVTQRTLRFYESRGLLSPQRNGRTRIYRRADCDRIALVLKGRKLGFTLTEIGQMIDAQQGRVSAQALRVSRDRCLEQIKFLENQYSEIDQALAELRRIYSCLSAKIVGLDNEPPPPKLDNMPLMTSASSRTGDRIRLRR